MELRYGAEVYAICRECERLEEDSPGHWRSVIVGTESEDFIVSVGDLLRNNFGPVLKMNYVERANGLATCIVESPFSNKKVVRQVPLDDLVLPKDLLGYVH